MPFTGSTSTWSSPKAITAMPKWVDRCVTVGDVGTFTNHKFTVDNSGDDRMRITSTSPTGNANLRRAYGLPGTFCADGEMRVTLYTNDKPTTWHDIAYYQWGTVFRLQTAKHIVARGIATAGVVGSLTDGAATWVNQQFIGAAGGYREHFIGITSGTGSGQTKRIINSTNAGVITPESNFATAPDNTSRYEIFTYDSRGIYVLNTIQSGAHALFQCTIFDSTNYFSNPAPNTGTDVNGFLVAFIINPLGAFGPFDDLPWHMKAKVVNDQISIAVWSDQRAEPAYGTTDASATWTVPAGFEAPGLMGVYGGHLRDAEWMKFDNIQARPFV